MKKLTAAIILFASPAFAQTPCNYTKDVRTDWKHEIEKTTNIKRNVFPYVENTRKCMMTMDVTIDGKVYPTSGNYVFGPDMTENNACDQATIKAKKEAIGIVSSEILTAKTQLNCAQNKPVQQAVTKQQPKKQPTITMVQRNNPATGVSFNLGFQTNIGDILGALIQ